MKLPTKFLIPSGDDSKPHTVHVADSIEECWLPEGRIYNVAHTLIFCVDPIRNIAVEESIKQIKANEIF